MLRKPPLRTYQKKKTAQSSTANHQQFNLWEPKTLAKRTSTNTKKIETPLPQYDESTIHDFSNSCDTTFDRLAKTARLPPPVHFDSQSSIDISSDVAIRDEPSLVKTDLYKVPTRNESQRGRGRPKRRANQSRTVQEGTEVVLKKRLKQDLVNLSVKKVRPVRNSRRKVVAQTLKTSGNRRKKQDVEDRDLAENDAKDWFVLPVERVGEDDKKKKKGRPLRRKKNVMTICVSSCSDGDNVDEKAEERKNLKGKQKLRVFSTLTTSTSKLRGFLETENASKGEEENNWDAEESGEKENKETDLGCSVNTGRMSTISNRTRSKLAMRNSPALEYSANFRRYSALKQSDNDLVAENCSNPKTYNRILTRRQYVSQTRSKVARKSETGALTNSINVSTRRRRSGHPDIRENDKITKPCFIVLPKCKENEDPVLSSNHVHSSGDIFQSSISIINQETQDAVNVELHESERTAEAPLSQNKSDLVSNIDRITNRKQKRDPKQMLNYVTCSTPIKALVNIDDRSINCLSPIDGREDNLGINNIRSGKELLDVPKFSTRRSSARKRLSISYEEDKSFEPSNENCRNVEDRQNSEHIQSPTSEIQESLKILKLNLGSSASKHNADEHRLSQKKIAATSTDSNRSNVVSERTNKYCSTNEFTGKSRDTCSQLTPVGIISTRSGRQLKLSVSTQEKFFNDSNDAKVLPATPKISDDQRGDPGYEIIDNSETEIPTHRINKIRGSRFTVFKTAPKRNTFTDVKSISIPHENDSDEIEPAISTSGGRASNGSNASGELKTISSEVHNRFSTPDNRGDSESTSSSVLDDERNNVSVSVADDRQSIYTKSSNENVLQSLIESTKNLDSLNIKSNNDESQSSSYPKNNNSDSDWNTLSSNGSIEDASSLKPDMTNKSVSEDSPQSRTENDQNNSEAGSSRENNDSTMSDVNEEKNKESFKETKLIDSPLASDKDKLDSDSSVKDEDETTKTVTDVSFNTTEMALSERLKLLSTRINIRKRRKTVLNPVTKNALEVSGNQDATWSSSNSKSTSSFEDQEKDGEIEEADSHNEPGDSDLFKRPSDPKSIMNLQPIVLVEKLKDPVRISTSNTKALNSALTAIQETTEIITQDCNESSSSNDSKQEKSSEHVGGSEPSDSALERPENMDNSSFKEDRTPASDSECGASKLDLMEPEVVRRQSVFLKPGKDWARSLSVLNHIQDGTNLALLSSGKGKNWRESVQTILDMQRERAVQSCLGKNEDAKDVQPYFKAHNCTSVPEWTPCSEEPSLRSSSPSRFIRRMSIRVVPDNKKLSRIEDTSFLEAYGLTASKSRKTFARISESKCKKSLVYNVECEDAVIETIETGRLITPRDVVLQRCGQEDYLPFIECFPAEYLESCRKIGEGVYGEVFLYENGKEKAVIKIIPIEGTALVNGERQKKFDEILSEIVIAKELHNLRCGEKYQTHGFVEVRNIKCISGKYPGELIELWKAYDDDKGSENDCPSMFDENQLYIVLELGHGGQDLEAFVFPSAVQAHALFVQTALALAVAEQSLEFEHRDLHWGNILISNTNESQIAFKLNNREYSYPTKGMQVAIIDFTLSRMSYEGCCIFNDLALDPALFTAEGEYQFEIYRLMREKIGNDWQRFEPYTNVLWLHYTLDKMITALRYKKKSTKVHKEAISRLQDLKNIVLKYNSAFDFVTNCDQITRLQCNSTAVQSTQIETDELNESK